MQQADHAALFGQTGRAVMAALVEFARGLEPQFTPEETARMVAAAGDWRRRARGNRVARDCRHDRGG